jgi:deoxyribonuclease-4
MSDVAETILGITGRIDLVHCNDSRDAFDSGADRHANLGNGNIALDDIMHCLDIAAAPIILETPHDQVVADLEILRARVGN